MRKWMMGLLALTLLTGCSSGSGDAGGNIAENSEVASEAISETETSAENEDLTEEEMYTETESETEETPTETDSVIEEETEAESKAEEENEDLVDEITGYEPIVFTDASGFQMTLTCTGISDTEITFIIRNDASEKTLRYGPHFSLFLVSDDDWEEVEYREYEGEELAFNDVSYSLKPGDEKTIEVSIEQLWGDLEPGHYKILLGGFHYYWPDQIWVEYNFDYGFEDESEESPTGYPNGQEQQIYAYYNDALYYYENLSTTSTLPDDAVNVGTAIITTELPDSDLEVSCMPEGTEIYYSEAKDKIYLTTDGEEYWILNCIG